MSVPAAGFEKKTEQHILDNAGSRGPRGGARMTAGLGHASCADALVAYLRQSRPAWAASWWPELPTRQGHHRRSGHPRDSDAGRAMTDRLYGTRRAGGVAQGDMKAESASEPAAGGPSRGAGRELMARALAAFHREQGFITWCSGSWLNNAGLSWNEYGLFLRRGPLAGETEESVHAAVGLSWIPRVTREPRQSSRRRTEGRLPTLGGVAGSRGDQHAHTTATDGRHSPERDGGRGQASWISGISPSPIIPRRLDDGQGLDATRLSSTERRNRSAEPRPRQAFDC